MKTLDFTIIEDKCIQCDACVKDCPARIIVRENNIPFIESESENNCIECQHCLAVCPTGAVSIFGLKPENSIPLTPGASPSLAQMETLFRGRRSVRQFRKENVPKEIIDRLLATVANSPTGCNDRDLTFTVVDDRKDIDILRENLVLAIESKVASGAAIAPFLPDFVATYRKHGIDEFFRGSPHLLIISTGERATCPQEDINIALAYFELLAHSAGLGATWCGMLKFALGAVPELRPMFGLGPNTLFYAMMFGHPDVHYARTVQRDNAATIRRVKIG